jgi:SAM-dependent methyltransferase
MYLGFHYPRSGEADGITPIVQHDNSPVHGIRFAQRVAEILVSLQPLHHERGRRTVLDIGCAVGGSSFELAKTYDHVDAFDLSSKFITTAKLVQSNPNNVQFRIPIEGTIHKTVTVQLDPDITAEIRQKVNFVVGDACNIPEMVCSKQIQESYDGAILSNLLCRLPDPITCLNSLPSIINTDGVVVIVTPFTWLEEFTVADNWLGGIMIQQRMNHLFQGSFI